VMGNGMVIDLEHLVHEIENLRRGGIAISPENLKISERAVICMPYHKLLDCYEEDRLADAKYGSTRRGIAPVYGDKYMKKALRMGDLFHPETTKARLADIVAYKNLTIEGVYGRPPVSADDMWAWLVEYGDILKPYICDAGLYLDKAAKAGKNILFEAQLGALRDIDFGIYPYTSSSPTVSAYAPVGAGIPGRRLDQAIGVMKAYSTCVGEGPFVCELHGEEARALREAGGEYGAATGRPRRVGPFDAVASRYGVRMQGASQLALTKLDVLGGFETLRVCTHYEVDGQRTDRFPAGERLLRAKPVYEAVPGWGCDISGCRTWQQLPAAAQRYVQMLEEAVGCRVRYISVGPAREACLVRRC